MKSNFFNRVVNLIAISKQKKIIEKNIIFFSMTFLEMAALFNFMFLMEMLIFFYKQIELWHIFSIEHLTEFTNTLFQFREYIVFIPKEFVMF